MAFVRPTLSELVTRISGDFVTRLALPGALVRRSVVGVFARVLAGAVHMLYGHLEYLARQIFPDQSDDAFLIRQAAVFGLTKVPPSYARATLEFTGTNGTVIPAGTIVVRADGARYRTLADSPIGGSTTYIETQAVEAGAASTIAPGTAFTLESPINGINALVGVDSVDADGTDEETTESLRARLLARIADPPHGGTAADYVAWAKSVAGVTRVWVTPGGRGPGTVLVRFVRDDDAIPIPSSGEVAQVRAYLLTRAPAVVAGTPGNSGLYVEAPVAAPVNFTIGVTPNTVAVKDAVSASLRALLARVEPGGTLLTSTVHTAIGTASGLTDYTLALPAYDTAFAPDQIPTMGTITWS
ncbi:MAG: baseplate J/gp47 family protein [Myxococcota bacterium]